MGDGSSPMANAKIRRAHGRVAKVVEI